MRRMTAILLGLAALALAACSLVREKGPAEGAAEAAYAAFAKGDLAAMKAMCAPDLLGVWDEAKVRQLSALVPREAVRRDETLQWQIVNSGGVEAARVARAYRYPSKEVLWRTTLVHDPASGRWLLNAFDVRVAAPEALARGNALSFAGKSALHYGALAWLVLSLLFILWAVIAVVRAPKFRWKWAFGLLCLVSVGQLTLNWTTGEWGVQALNISLLGLGLIKGPSAWGQWILTAAFPLGALISLTRVAQVRREAARATRETF